MKEPLLVLQSFFAERLPDRDLTPDESLALAGDLAGRPDLWRRLVRHSDDERIYTSLFRNPHLDVWLICWNQRQETGLHDHDLSGGAVWVVEGELDEDRLALGAGIDSTRYHAGEAFAFDATRIHDVRHAGERPTVSLHLYSPPLWRMGHYEVGAEGRLGRRSASYAEELRST